jgi:glycosyltransferase involved in cell wall biosynthesis
MWVDVKTTADSRVAAPESFSSNSRRAARIAVEQIPTVLAGQRGRALASTARFGGLKAKRINASNADIVDMHWTGFGFLTIEEIGRIAKPMVWTMHDMWAFLGADHYEPDDADARWRTGYLKANRSSGEPGRDLDRWAWSRKKRSWTTPHQLVAPSSWLADCARQSALLGAWPTIVIPNPLDLVSYRPRDRAGARDLLGLPQNVPLILFGVVSGLTDDRKGWDLLRQALPQVKRDLPDAEVVILGHDRPQVGLGIDLPIAHWLGQLSDDLTLSLAYSAVDVAVVPSRQDNLPQSGTEPQACGCPVVAFNTGGLPDVVAHGETGYLAKAFDAQDLARGIVSIAGSRELHGRMSQAARDRAERLWAEGVVAGQYLDLYSDVLDRRRA